VARNAKQKSKINAKQDSQAESLWAEHGELYRDPAQINGHFGGASDIDQRLLDFKVKGDWWGVLERLKITLLVGREYEHFVLALGSGKRPEISYMPLPHPSGIAVDRQKSLVHIASTRNPNQIFTLKPVKGLCDRDDVDVLLPLTKPLVSVRSTFYPGCLYIHDLAIIGGKLHANAVGQNAIVKIEEDGSLEHVWWPHCIERDGEPDFGKNYIQLNSIAAGANLSQSFFSASSDKMSTRRPGHQNYPVDGRGVIFSGKTAEVVARGLTRPHSARLSGASGREKIWVDNSGYGEFGYIDNEVFCPVVTLPGWTRGLSICQDVAFVGTSRVIPRFAQYAPGLDVNSSICAVHAIAIKSGQVLGSIVWNYGNQIFAIDWLPVKQSAGFPFLYKGNKDLKNTRGLFYAFKT
jgi:uncharacterized protein (TIGR03032 family)